MAIGATSCSFLDLTDPDSFDETKFYRDSTDLENLLNSSYQAIRPAYDKLFFVTEMKSDNATTTDMGTSGGLYYTFVSHNVTSSNTIVAEIYNAFYIAIHRANLVLEHVDQVTMSDAERARLRGEALYLRALSHFYLVRLWGPVTIMRHTVVGSEASTSLKRSPVSEVYAFIIEDLKTIADGESMYNTPPCWCIYIAKMVRASVVHPKQPPVPSWAASICSRLLRRTNPNSIQMPSPISSAL